MQQLLQELFERECRNYEFYLQRYQKVAKQYDEIGEMQKEISKYIWDSERVLQMAKILESKSFENEKAKINLPDNFKEFEKAFLEYKPIDREQEQKELSKKEKESGELLSILRANAKESIEKLYSYISKAYERKIKFIFDKNDEIIMQIFILYYSERFNFDFRRKVIEEESCKFSEEFMKAYMAETSEEEEKAKKWFEEQRDKYKVF